MMRRRDVQFNEDGKGCKLGTFDTSNENDYRLILNFTDTVETESQSKTPTEAEAPQAEVSIQRSARERCPPDYYGRGECNLTQTPTIFKEAASSSDKQKWKNVMDAEMKSLEENEVWDLVPLPAVRKTVGSKWVYKINTGADGLVQRYKARLVAQGYTQKFGTDYDEIFCPVI